QLLSSVGTQSTAIAYPLLVLALTRSAADAGVVAFTRALAQVLWILPAGLAAAHCPRRALMIAADGLPLAASAALGASLVTADAASYLVSTGSLLAMRTPFQEEREPDSAPIGERLTAGFRFLWRQPFLRTTALLFGLGNFIGPGVLLALVVIGRRQGLSSGAV